MNSDKMIDIINQGIDSRIENNPYDPSSLEFLNDQYQMVDKEFKELLMNGKIQEAQELGKVRDQIGVILKKVQRKTLLDSRDISIFNQLISVLKEKGKEVDLKQGVDDAQKEYDELQKEIERTEKYIAQYEKFIIEHKMNTRKYQRQEKVEQFLDNVSHVVPDPFGRLFSNENDIQKVERRNNKDGHEIETKRLVELKQKQAELRARLKAAKEEYESYVNAGIQPQDDYAQVVNNSEDGTRGRR